MKLSIEKVSKTYKSAQRKALDGFQLDLTAGVYGLLGPNGAGKSTLMNILTDNVQADSGRITYNEKETLSMGKDFRNILGYMPQHQGLYDHFTANRFLWYMAALKGLKKSVAKERIGKVLEAVNLQEDAHKKLGAFSGGMKQRILIAQALLNDPEILILDEPTAGLDPKERVRIRNFISEIALNKIVIIATHVVSDIESIAKEVIFLKQGKLVLKDTPSKVLQHMAHKVWQVQVAPEELQEVQRKYLVSNLVGETEGKVAVKIISEHCPEEYGGIPTLPTLEDLYLYIFADDMY